MTRIKSNLCLLLTALIWGCAFVAQSVASATVGPFAFNGIRFLIAAVTVFLLLPVLEKITGEGSEKQKDAGTLWKAGILSGFVLLTASVLQQGGIAWTTAGKAGFLTSLYVVLVPIAGILVGKRPKPTVFIACLIALAALYLLSKPERGALGKGDVLLILSAVCFTIHILVIDHFAPQVDAAKFSAVQFLAAGLFGMLGTALFETPTNAGIKQAMIPILYAGVFSAGIGYTLQTYGQKGAEPSEASVLLSLESVFSALAGFVILHETLSVRELFGCALMFAAVLLSQKQ